MKKTIINWWKTRSNALRAALNTAWQTFVGVFAIALLGYISAIASWADSEAGEFPSASPLAKAAVAALAAASSFLVTWTVRGYQQSKNPATGPHYNR